MISRVTFLSPVSALDSFGVNGWLIKWSLMELKGRGRAGALHLPLAGRFRARIIAWIRKIHRVTFAVRIYELEPQ